MKNSKPANKPDEFINILDLWHLCVKRWHWFVISLAFFLALGAYYLHVTPNLYTREAAILVKQETQGKGAGKNVSGEDFNDLGLVLQTTNVRNVQHQLASLDVLSEVARRITKDKRERLILKKAQEIQSQLKSEIDDDKSTIINLKYVDFTPDQAEKVLGLIIQVYNEKWLERRNEMAANTSRFIEGRLKLLENDLSIVDDSISKFKARNKITNLERVSELYLQQLTTTDAQILNLTNQKSTAEYILHILQNKESRHQLLPTNSGVNNSVAEAQITQYNNMLIQLKNNMYNTSDQNPIIRKQESDLNDIRKNIIATIKNHINALNIQLQNYENASSEADSKIANNPGQEKYLLSVERDQKVKETLYLYLLQKKEENEIGMTYTSFNTQLIDMPHGSGKPTSPNKRNVIMGMVLLGLIIPIITIFVRESLNSTIRSKYELEAKTDLPIIGEIPLRNDFRDITAISRFIPFGKKESSKSFVVQPNKSDNVNETFRRIRTEIEQSAQNQSSNRVYLITSNYKGAGKTFVAMNLAKTLSINSHKVLLIDADMRSASVSRLLNNMGKGLADYLSDETVSTDEVITQIGADSHLDLLPAGTSAPNPTELLSKVRFKLLLEEKSKYYDYIIIDSPATDTFADANIIDCNVRNILFIMRAGQFESKGIEDLGKMALKKEHQQLQVILNAVEKSRT